MVFSFCGYFFLKKNLLPWRSLYRLWGPLIIIKRCRDTTEYIPGMFLTSGTPAARLTTNSIASRAPKHQPNSLKPGAKSQVFASKSTNLCVPKVTLLFNSLAQERAQTVTGDSLGPCLTFGLFLIECFIFRRYKHAQSIPGMILSRSTWCLNFLSLISS